MKIEEAYLQIVEKELEENLLRNTLAAAAMAGTLATGVTGYHTTKNDPVANVYSKQITRSVSGVVQPQQIQPEQDEDDEERTKDFPREHLLKTVTDKFNINPKKAEKIVDAALRHQKPEFPRAHHILAIAGIESSFNERAKSKLRYDPAVGLMQIRPRVWNINKKDLSTIDGQIKHGAQILHSYFQKTGDEESAVKAYNIGLTNFNRGIQHDAAHRYLKKFNDEIDRYEED